MSQTETLPPKACCLKVSSGQRTIQNCLNHKKENGKCGNGFKMDNSSFPLEMGLRSPSSLESKWFCGLSGPTE